MKTTRIPLTGSSDLDPQKFYSLVKILKSVGSSLKTSMRDSRRLMLPVIEDLDDEVFNVAKSAMAISREEQRTSRTREMFSAEQDSDMFGGRRSMPFLEMVYAILEVP